MSDIQNAAGGLDSVFGSLLLGLSQRRNAGAILLYHRIAPYADPAYPPLATALFDAHCAFLKSRFHILPLTEFVTRHAQRKPLRRCCAITFDDGYRDFLEYAYPILAKHALPATHFLVADCLASGAPTWNLRLNRIQLCLGERKTDPRIAATQEPALARLAAQSQNEATTEVGALSSHRRDDWLEEMERKISGLFGPPPPLPAMLDANDIKQCDSSLIEWGSHTLSHAMLANCDAAELRHELKESRIRLEAAANAPVRFLSYPNGSYSTDAMEAARDCGYDAAFAVEQHAASARSPLYALPRFDIAPTSRASLPVELSGAMQTMRRLRSAVRGGGRR